jgi:hypothetical protein
LDKIAKAASGLVAQGYLLARDVPDVMKRASAHWDWAARPSVP